MYFLLIRNKNLEEEEEEKEEEIAFALICITSYLHASLLLTRLSALSERRDVLSNSDKPVNFCQHPSIGASTPRVYFPSINLR